MFKEELLRWVHQESVLLFFVFVVIVFFYNVLLIFVLMIMGLLPSPTFQNCSQLIRESFLHLEPAECRSMIPRRKINYVELFILPIAGRAFFKRNI